MSGTFGELSFGEGAFGVSSTSTPIPQSHIEDALQPFQGDKEVDLYRVDLYGGNSVFLSPDVTVTWNGYTWEGIGIHLSGEGSYGDEKVSRPKLSIENPGGAFSPFMSQGAYNNAVVTRYRVLQSDLATDVPIYTTQVWQIGRVAIGTRIAITFELRGFADTPNFIIPANTYSPPKYPLVSL